MFSCGWAKTIRIRQRILRKYSEVRKNTHYCVGHGKALEFLSISLRDTVPIMHTREERLFFFSSKRLVTILSLARQPGDLKSLFNSPYCFCEGKLFWEVNLWHLTALSSLWLLAHKAFTESLHFSRLAAMDLTSSRNSYPAFFLSFLLNRAPPCGLWTSSSSVSFWCLSHYCVSVAVLVLY